MAGLDFNPLEFFKEEIKHDSAAIRNAAVNNIHLIASALGPEKTVDDLIPCLVSLSQAPPLSNDEEFLYTIAKQFASLTEFMPQGRDEVLIAPLEELAAQEETVIRDQAIQSLCQIVERRPALVQTYLVPTLHRLAVKTDFFTARVSACALFPTAYKHSDEVEQEKLRKAYVSICSDDTPMVRRAAANKMKDLIQECDKNAFLHDLAPIFGTLSRDDTQDTIRIAVVNATLVVAVMLTPDENRQHTISIIKEASVDRSWRVRLTVAKKFDQLCKSFGPDLMLSDLVACLCTLMKDNEAEVRKEAVQAVNLCLKLPHPFTAAVLQEFIIPMFTQTVALDPAQPVRAALANVLGPVAKYLGRDITQRQLLPLISDLMKDEFHDVRLNIVSHAGLICEVLSVDGLVHSLLHTIQSLIMDNHWRIRKSVVEQVPQLAKLFGQEMFQSKLEALFLTSLRDSVHTVRQAAIKHLKEIVVEFGQNWTVDHLMPKLLEQYSSGTGYANRVTTLQVLPQVASVMNSQQIGKMIVPLLTRATTDSVPNVRFCSCRTILDIQEAHQLDKTSLSDIVEALTKLEHDTDVDVQYFAQRALAKAPRS